MGTSREVVIPLKVIAEGDGSRCVDLLQQALQAEPGIRGLALDMPEGRLSLRYDPVRVSLKRTQELARLLGVELGHRFDRCALRLQGVRCADCSLALAKELQRVPGVSRVTVNPATGSLAIEYDTTAANLKTFEERIGRAGYAVQQPPRTRAALKAVQEHDAAARRRQAMLVAVCFVSWLTGLLGEKFSIVPPAVVLGLYALAYLAGGLPSTIRSLRELRSGAVSIDLLMVCAAVGAAAVGEFPEGAFLLFLFSFSNALEEYVLDRTRRAIEALMHLSPDQATVRRDGREQQVEAEEVRVGDVMIVRPGERIAADGEVVQGHTSVDQSAMTGESMPVEKETGDPVFAGTLNQRGAIEVRVTRPAGTSTLARIVALVEEAQSERAESQRFTDWFGARYTIAVLAAAAVTLAVPVLTLGQPFGPAFYRAMTVVVVASPCAVVISIPAAILAAITGGARAGVLFKGGAHLERAAKVRAIAFDKTGTLTVGRPRLIDLRVAEGSSPDEVLQVAASAESLSEHPLANAVVEAAREKGLDLLASSDLEALVGQGVRARVGAREVWIGKAELFTCRGCTVPAALVAAATDWASAGKTVLFVGDVNRVLGVLAVADTLRPGTEEAMRQLRALGIDRLVMLTGDNLRVAQAIADRLGMGFRAELLPEGKLQEIKELQRQHGVVAMVGDGINDAPSLAAADLGISLGGTGTDVALETADVVLMADDLRHLPYGIALARQAQRVIRENLVFAFAVMAGLLVATFLTPLPMPVAVIGHEGSTVLVILNGLRLLAFRPGYGTLARPENSAILNKQ